MQDPILPDLETEKHKGAAQAFHKFAFWLQNSWKFTDEEISQALKLSPQDTASLLKGEFWFRGEPGDQETRERTACLFQICRIITSMFRDYEVEYEYIRETQKFLHETRTPMDLITSDDIHDMRIMKEYISTVAGI